LPNAWDAISDQQCNKAMDLSCKMFATYLEQIQLPIKNVDDLERELMRATDSLIESYFKATEGYSSGRMLEHLFQNINTQM